MAFAAREGQEYVVCVQKQLAALGVAAVSPNGSINSATRSGAEAIRAKYPTRAGIALLPRMSEKSAVSWCREIGALGAQTRQFMPGAAAPIIIGPGGQQTAILQNAFREVESFFRSFYNITPASRADVAGGASGKELAQFAVQLQRKRGRSYGRMSEYVSRMCETPSRRYGGQAYRNQLLICWPVSKSYDSSWYRGVYPIVSAIMAHEYMHHVQRELTNDKISSGSYSSRRKMGPAWMVEGAAEVAENNWRVTKLGVKRKSLVEMQAYASENRKPLGGMHSYGTVKDAKQYRVAFLAVYLLAERSGEQAVLNYWRYIGQGKSWEAAFKAAFGLSLNSFTNQFERMRSDPTAARAFISGA